MGGARNLNLGGQWGARARAQGNDGNDGNEVNKVVKCNKH